MAVIHVKNLTKSYKTLKAVDSISFDVSEGEIFALIGPNGAGKTTTLKTISTLLIPTSGTVTISGYDVIKKPDMVRTLITYLPEEAGAYRNMTGESYLKFMAELVAPNKKDSNEYYANGKEISNLKNRLKDKVSTYSKGMTRKLLLARTLMSAPKVAILDEPTSGLDVINALDIRKTIKEFAKNGTTILLSSHNMLEIEFLSDRVGIMNNGKLVEIGTPQQLLTQYKCANLEEVFAKLTTQKSE